MYDTALINEHKKAIRAGYDASVIPIDKDALRKEVKGFVSDMRKPRQGKKIPVTSAAGGIRGVLVPKKEEHRNIALSSRNLQNPLKKFFG